MFLTVLLQVAIFMEQENLRLGRARGFQGIFTTNANRLTQLISRSLDYRILSSIQVVFVEHTQTLFTEKKGFFGRQCLF